MPEAECANGKLDPAETCEGDPLPEGCDPASCTVQAGYACSPEPPTDEPEETGGVVEPPAWMSTCMLLPTCGNSIVEDGETCDDGDTFADDGCSDTCQIEEGWACTGMPSECEKCGDGFIDPGEDCDGGIDLGMASPGCTETCLVIPGWSCSGMPSLCGPICGDGMWFDDSVEDVTPGFAEGCDDGNKDNGDGCNALCKVESGCVCDGNPPGISTCTCGAGDSSDSGSDSGSDTAGDSGSDSGTGGSSGASTSSGSGSSTG